MKDVDSAIKVKVHNYNRSVHVDSTCLFTNNYAWRLLPH